MEALNQHVAGLDDSTLARHADEEETEVQISVTDRTGYPKPHTRHRLVYWAVNASVEESYYWTLEALRTDYGFNEFHKITDIFAASEHSAFFGVSEQRLSLQQEKVATYLRGISEMLKSLFQIVRELRIIDERLSYYDYTYAQDKDNSYSAEIALKGIWADQVEGGVKNAASVYGLSQTVGFTVLPDLFFRMRIPDKGLNEYVDKPEFNAKAQELYTRIDETVEKLEGFNEKVKEVLKRKLSQYYTWKTRTYRELYFRKRFTMKYLKQHYETIRLYMGWIRPYLKNIRRLQLAEKLRSERSVDLVSAFEQTLIEVEFLAKKSATQRGPTGQPPSRLRQLKTYFPVMIVSFKFRTEPQLSYIGEGYQRGPVHTGMLDMVIRGYMWTQQHIENYKLMRQEEDMDLLRAIDQSVNEALTALGSELYEYLGLLEEPKPAAAESRKGSPLFDEFKAVWRGMKELFGAFSPGELNIFKPHEDAVGLQSELEAARGELRYVQYQVYKNFKKAHDMLQW